MKTFTLTIDEKLSSYLERLTYEIDSRKSIIDFMFTQHKNDTDSSLFESIPWKTYMKEYQDLYVEFDMAKFEASKIVMSAVKNKFGETFDCTWKVIDFKNQLVEVIVNDHSNEGIKDA